MTIEKCPNPDCKDGWIGVLDNDLGTPVACCICEGKGSVMIKKTEISPATFSVDEFANCFETEFQGVAAIGYLEKSLREHARALRVMMEEEARNPFPNNHLIAVLRDAACLGYEHLDVIMRRKTQGSSKGAK